MWTVRCGEISCDSIGAAAGLADLSDDGFRFLRAASVMDEHLGAGLGERQCAGAPNAARGAGDESRFSESAGMGLSRLDIEAYGRLCLGRPS